MGHDELKGVPYAPVTAFDADGSFSEDRFRNLILNNIHEANFSFVFALASLGEFAYLTAEERKHVAETTVDAVDGEVPVYVGVSSISTAKAVEFATHAESAGVDGVVLNPWAYYPHTNDEVVSHYNSVDEAIDIPILAYDNPRSTNVTMDVDLLSRLVEIDGVRHIKAGMGNLETYRTLVDRWSDDISIFAVHPHSFEKLAYGADGWMTMIAMVRPVRAVELYDALDSGNLSEFRERYSSWRPLYKFFSDEHLAAGLKAIANLQGNPVGEPRDPLDPLPDEKLRRLEEILEQLDAL